MQTTINNQILTALRQHKKAFYSIAVFTAVMNILLLVPSIYMLEIYDRVLTSRNEYTLLMLTLIVTLLYIIYAALDMIRSHAVIHISEKLDTALNTKTYEAAFQKNIKTSAVNGNLPLSDLNTLRQFVTGPSLYAFFDAPWFPFYIIVIFLFNFWLGLYALFCVAILILLAYINERRTHEELSKANGYSILSMNMANHHFRQAEIVQALGMFSVIRERWQLLHKQYLKEQNDASQTAASIGAATKFVRTLMQSGILGLAAYLVLKNQLSPGVMIAATILLGKATSPVETIIGSWRIWKGAVGAHERLNLLFQDYPEQSIGMSLEKPVGRLALEGVSVKAPDGDQLILKNIHFSLEPGDVLGIVGPSASGKSSLARALVGLWPSVSNPVRLDGADIYLWNKDELGANLGYVPQEIDFFMGTIAENIARFRDPEASKVIEAAKLSGVRDMILRLPSGYDSVIGESGITLSGGQKQRLALTRALYGNPCLIVLDEPNSNLDEMGELALIHTLHLLKSQKKTVVLITHKNQLLQCCNKLLVLNQGQVHLFGPTSEVVSKLKLAREKKPEPSAPQVKRGV